MIDLDNKQSKMQKSFFFLRFNLEMTQVKSAFIIGQENHTRMMKNDDDEKLRVYYLHKCRLIF